MHTNNNYGLQFNGITETLNNNMHYTAQHVYTATQHLTTLHTFKLNLLSCY